ncbi:hypothetical protein GGF46_004228 [Coemansia sp. RSA 552]|nr:hypothetical protein GGF46_004228 [Coemansia sp. RSA 552]
MELEAGRPVFLEELVDQAQDWFGTTVRATGTLLEYRAQTDRAVLVDGQYAVVVDTRLMGVQKYHVGQTYQVIGQVDRIEGDRAAADPFEDARWHASMAVRARVLRRVDGLDMAVYRKAVLAQRQLLGTTEVASVGKADGCVDST